MGLVRGHGEEDSGGLHRGLAVGDRETGEEATG